MSPQQAVPASSDSPFTVRSILAPLITVIIGMFMVILDSTVVNVALHELEQELRSPLSTIQWTITGYTLALSAVIPIAGWMMDKFGAKRIFLFTISLFTIGSAFCATAQTIDQLIIYRIIQGLGGGMVIPIGMAILFRLAPPERRGAVMAMIGIPLLLAPALGPVLSGWLIGYASWHWLFWINAPIGVIGVLIGVKYLPMFEQSKAPALDIPGMILAPIAFTMLAFGVSEAGKTSWSNNLPLSGLLIGGIALLLFIIVELRHKQPLLELRVFRSSDFTRGILLMWIAQICLIAVTIPVPLFLQSVKHFTPLQTGLTVLPQAIAAMIFMSIGGRLFDKFGARPLTLAGFSIAAGALVLFSFIDLETPIIMIILPLFMMGTGMGLTVMTLETYVLSSAPPNLVNRVTPLTTATLQVATSFAVAGLTSFLTFRTGAHAMHAGPNNQTLEAAIMAYGDTFLLSAVLAIVGVIISIILRKPKVESKGELISTDPTSARA